MTVYAAVIAVTKDLPDVAGDIKGGIDTFASRLGVRKVANGASAALALNYAAAVATACLAPAGAFQAVADGGRPPAGRGLAPQGVEGTRRQAPARARRSASSPTRARSQRCVPSDLEPLLLRDSAPIAVAIAAGTLPHFQDHAWTSEAQSSRRAPHLFQLRSCYCEPVSRGPAGRPTKVARRQRSATSRQPQLSSDLGRRRHQIESRRPMRPKAIAAVLLGPRACRARTATLDADRGAARAPSCCPGAIVGPARRRRHRRRRRLRPPSPAPQSPRPRLPRLIHSTSRSTRRALERPSHKPSTRAAADAPRRSCRRNCAGSTSRTGPSPSSPEPNRGREELLSYSCIDGVLDRLPLSHSSAAGAPTPPAASSRSSACPGTGRAPRSPPPGVDTSTQSSSRRTVAPASGSGVRLLHLFALVGVEGQRRRGVQRHPALLEDGPHLCFFESSPDLRTSPAASLLVRRRLPRSCRICAARR